MQPEIPPFIVKGSQLLTNFAASFPTSSGRIHLSPIFVRNLKFNTLTEEEEVKVKQLVFTLSLFRSECHELHELASSDILLVLCALAIKDGLWNRNRWSETRAKLQQHCPHILSRHAVKDLPIQFSFPDLNSLDISLSALQCEALLLRRNKLNNKLKKLKSLRQNKETLQSRLQSQLREIRLTEITGLSPRLIKNIINGLDLNAPAATLSEEMHRFHEMLADLEQDYKDEELFWRWIVGPDTQRSASSSSAELNHFRQQQLISSINSARAEVEGHILELLKSKSFSDSNQLQQLYTEANESLKLALSSLQPTAQALIENTNDVEATTAQEEITLQAMLNDLLLKTNLISPIIATINNHNSTKS